MKTQYKTAILSTVALLITLVAAFLLTLYSFRFIAKWLELINAIIIGVLSSAILLFFSSLINFNVIRKSNARNIGALLYKLRNDMFDLFRIIRSFEDDNSRAIIPERYFTEVETLLLSLKNTLFALLSAEKISPLTFKTIEFLKRFASKFAKDEHEFFKLCSFLSERISSSYRNVREARYTQFNERVFVVNLARDLDPLLNAFERNSDEYIVFENYQHDIGKYVKTGADN